MELGYEQTLLAALLATTLVAGARALEGSGSCQRDARRGSLPAASQLARSWLWCFSAIAGVFLLTQMVAKLSPPSEELQNSGADISVTGTLQIRAAGETHGVEIAGRKGN